MSDRADSPANEERRREEDEEETRPPQDHDSDSDSELSEADEDLLKDEDLDAEIREVNEAAAAQRGIDLDADNLKQLKAPRRMVVDRSREPPAQRSRGRARKRGRTTEEEEEAEGVTIEDDTRGGRKVRVKSVTPDEDLPEEERKKRELDRKIDAAVKGGSKRRRKKKTDIDLDRYQDDMINTVRKKMEQAAIDDVHSNENKRPATAKLRMLPEVRSILGNPLLANAALDNGLLKELRMWLEPLPTNALPAYDIQKEIFKWLESIRPDTDILRESGIGKIVLFYTKDIRPQHHIKRSAENLVREWSRPILGRSADYKTKQYKTAEYDPDEVHLGNVVATEEKPDALAPPARNPNRTRVPMSMAASYDIVPKSMVSNSNRQLPRNTGDDFLKRMKAKQMAERKAKRSTMKFS